MGGWWGCGGGTRLKGPGAERPSPRRGGNTRPKDQVFDSVTSHLQRADVTVAPWAPKNWKTNCRGERVVLGGEGAKGLDVGGGLIKETSVLSAEGLKLI